MSGIETLEIGIVGVGGVAQARHLPALIKMEDVHVAAVCDMNEKLVKSVARRYSVAGCYSDFSEMLAKEKLDIVDITVSPRAHAPLSIQAMNAGCHVLVEKPIAESVGEADEVVKVANDKGLHTRPSTELVKCASAFNSKINLYYRNYIVNCKSLLGILMLAAGKGARIEIEAEGDDADRAIHSILKLAKNKFNIKYYYLQYFIKLFQLY